MHMPGFVSLCSCMSIGDEELQQGSNWKRCESEFDWSFMLAVAIMILIVVAIYCQLPFKAQ